LSRVHALAEGQVLSAQGAGIGGVVGELERALDDRNESLVVRRHRPLGSFDLGKGAPRRNARRENAASRAWV